MHKHLKVIPAKSVSFRSSNKLIYVRREGLLVLIGHALVSGIGPHGCGELLGGISCKIPKL